MPENCRYMNVYEKVDTDSLANYTAKARGLRAFE